MTNPLAGGHAAQHLVGDVQRFGLLSAAAVVDRYTAVVDRATRDGAFRLPPPPGDSGTERLPDGAAQIAAAWLSVIDRTASLIANRAVPATDSPAIERLVLPPARPGACSETSLWVHNPRSSIAAGIDLCATSLTSATGDCLPVASVALSPERPEAIEPGSAREVRVRVEVPLDQRAGQYHGLVLTSAAPLQPIALHLDVGDHERAPR